MTTRALHWQTNFEGTRYLVDAAGEAGVKRFVFFQRNVFKQGVETVYGNASGELAQGDGSSPC